jgi:hypothetical protein
MGGPNLVRHHPILRALRIRNPHVPQREKWCERRAGSLAVPIHVLTTAPPAARSAVLCDEVILSSLAAQKPEESIAL